MSYRDTLVYSMNKHIASSNIKPFLCIHLGGFEKIQDKDPTKHLVKSCVRKDMHREAFWRRGKERTLVMLI